MEIKILKKATKEGRIFDKKEWQEVDLKHYGKRVKWRRKNFIIEAHDNSEVIAILHLKIEGGVAHIGSLIVGQKYRNKGIGKRLVDEAEQLSRESKAHKIYLETGESWGTVGFYQKLGYVKVALLKNHYQNKNFVQIEKFL